MLLNIFVSVVARRIYIHFVDNLIQWPSSTAQCVVLLLHISDDDQPIYIYSFAEMN